MESIFTKFTTYKHPVCFMNSESATYILPALFVCLYISNVIITLWYLMKDYKIMYERLPTMSNVLLVSYGINDVLLTLLLLSPVLFRNLFKNNIPIIIMMTIALVQSILGIIFIIESKRIQNNSKKRIHTDMTVVIVIGIVTVVTCMFTTFSCYCIDDSLPLLL